MLLPQSQRKALSCPAILISVFSGHGLSAALTRTGELFTWGFAHSLVFGQGGLGREPLQKPAEYDPHPTKVYVGGTEEDVRLQQIAVGAQHMLALGLDGEVWAWGKGSNGMLGLGGSSSDQPLPTPLAYFVELDVKITQVCCGSDFSLALDSQGRVYSWGANTRGQLGLGGGFSMDMENMPRKVDFGPEFANVKIAHLSAGNCHACAVSSSGEVFTWGYSAWTEPHWLTLLTGKHIIGTSSGRNFSAAWSADGEVYTWGKNYFVQRTGALGTGSAGGMSKRHPQLVKGLPTDNKAVKQVSCGDTHTLAVLTTTS